MLKQILNDNWTMRCAGGSSDAPAAVRDVAFPASVPGCVHTDLLRAGKIGDPYLDLNEFKQTWIGLTDWEFRCAFIADPKLFDHERIDLVFDGLDTIARIELNGSLVAETFNMHRTYRFDVRKSLKKGPNELRITFASPVKYAEMMQQRLGRRPYVNGPGGPFNFIRKMACNFGWDWGPALVTCGIWKGVRLEGWSTARIARIEPLDLVLNPGESEYAFFIHAEMTTGNSAVFGRLEWKTSNGDTASIESNLEYGTSLLFMRLQSPPLWWPRGYGEQSRFAADFALTGIDDGVIDSVSRKIAFRTVELDTSPDDIGRKFVLKVNGKPIFCKGFNWIPDDCFLDRACTKDRYRARIQQAIDAGGNMLRVWGGGIFETDDFYDLCDEMGVLVWQDFLFACAMHPEEEPFRSEVEAEARDNVARLAHHPSLAIWNGCNENIWAYRDWGWKDSDEVKGKTWGKNYYFELLPKICRELTPAIPYWAGSPWSGDYDVDNGIPPNAATHGNKHVWEAWFRQDYSVYRTMEPRFCSEFGFQGPANYSSIAKVIPPAARDFGSIEMRHRQKCGDRVRDDGDRRNLRHLIHHFNLPGAQELLNALEPPEPKGQVPYCGCEPVLPATSLPSQVNFDDLHYLLSVNQCRALTLGVEWFRSRQPTCMGTLYWQLNDCWPGGTTWSCIDGDGKPKLLWYATRKFFADQLLTIQPEKDGSLFLCVVNDSDKPFDEVMKVMRKGFDGQTLAEQSIVASVEPRSVQRIRLESNVATASDAAREMVVVGSPPRATWYFAVDRELRYPPAEFEATLDHADREYRLTIAAKTLMRDICILADRLDAEAKVNEQLVTLLPGEAFTFLISSKREMEKEQLTAASILRCVTQFGAE